MRVEKGLVYSNNLPIAHQLIPTVHYKSRPQKFMLPKYITIHNTGNPGATARANSNYVTSINEYKSWHFTVDNKEIFQHLPINEITWHAGDGEKGTGNNQSISIEICEIDGAEEMAIEFIAELLQVTRINIADIVPHQHWSGKYCPRLILPHWTTFVSNIEKEMNGGQNMTLEEALKVVQSKAQLDNNTMKYLQFYRYGNELILKLAKVITRE